jgi:PAS domain S-box-containing protein
MLPPPAVLLRALWGRLGRRMALPLSLRRLDTDVRLLLSLLLIVATALGAGLVIIRKAEQRMLESEAVRAAVHWAEFLQTRLGDLDEILVAGLVSENDRRTLDFAGAAGDVRDYQVIRPDGIVALSSWSGNFRDAIDPATILSVIRDERTLAQVVEDRIGGQRIVVGQAFVPLTSGNGQRGALKVDVDVTGSAVRYRGLGNGAFLLLICLLLPPSGLCGWLAHRNVRHRRGNEQLQRQRSQILEELAKGARLSDVLRRIAGFTEQHHKGSSCAILTADPSGRQDDSTSWQPAKGAGPTEDDARKGLLWSIPLRATSGLLLGRFILRCATAQEAQAAGSGPAAALAALAALAIECSAAERALTDMRQRHELILNAAGDGIFGVDAAGRVTFVNPAAARMLGRAPAEMIGKDTEALFRPAPAGERPIAATLRDGNSRRAEQIALLRRDGSHFYADLMVTPVLRRGSGLRAVITFHDISAQIHTQQLLLDAKEEAETASRAKSSFLAHMSHELRTPLNAIMGFSEVIAREVLGPIGNHQYHEYASHIHNSGSHLLSLINDLLDLSKIEAGKLTLHEEPVSLPALLQRCVVFVSEPLRSNGLGLVLEIDPTLDTVLCDERKLKQVVVNLLSNAVKFTPAGRITLAATRTGTDDLVLRVGDTGIGIAAEDIAEVMTPFGQIDGALSRQHRGTGLGLPLAKGLIELHGGSLALESEPGVGTTVTITLPHRVLAEAPPQQPALAVAGGRA